MRIMSNVSTAHSSHFFFFFLIELGYLKRFLKTAPFLTQFPHLLPLLSLCSHTLEIEKKPHTLSEDLSRGLELRCTLKRVFTRSKTLNYQKLALVSGRYCQHIIFLHIVLLPALMEMRPLWVLFYRWSPPDDREQQHWCLSSFKFHSSFQIITDQVFHYLDWN